MAAVWPEDANEEINGLFSHVGGETVIDNHAGPRMVRKIRDKLRTITEGVGESNRVWLVYAMHHGHEQNPNGNDRIRKMLHDEGIEFTEKQYRWGHNMAGKVELWPGNPPSEALHVE